MSVWDTLGAIGGTLVGGPAGAVAGAAAGGADVADEDLWTDIGEYVPLIGEIITTEKTKNAEKARARALARLESQLLDNPEYNNVYAPDLGVIDPAAIEAQRKALEYLQAVGSNKGLTPEDMYALNQIRKDQTQTERSQRDALMQNARMRGVANSGATLGSQLLAQQNAANQAAEQGLGVAALGQKRALEAMAQSGQLGGQMRSQSLQEQAARDSINRFNAAQRAGMLDRRIGLRQDTIEGKADSARRAIAAGMYGRQKLQDDVAQIGSMIAGGGAGGLPGAAGGAAAGGGQAAQQAPALDPNKLKLGGK